METAFRILEDAISDVGYWCWWAADFPRMVAAEFTAVQLWNPPAGEGEPPSGRLSLGFGKARTLAFLTHEAAKEGLDPQWPILLHEDKLEPPAVSHGWLALNNDEAIREILKGAGSVKTAFGVSPEDKEFWSSAYKLAFWAGSIGMVVGGEALVIRNHKEEVPLESIEAMSAKWWDYWKEYWERRSGSEPWPKDFACEVTIPLKDE